MITRERGRQETQRCDHGNRGQGETQRETRETEFENAALLTSKMEEEAGSQRTQLEMTKR